MKHLAIVTVALVCLSISRNASALKGVINRAHIGNKLLLKWFNSYKERRTFFELSTERRYINSFILFGFSDRGKTNNADLALFWTTIDGVSVARDAWTDENGIINTEEEQDIILTDWSTSRKRLTIRFWRKHDTCDEHDYAFDRGTTHLLYTLIPKGLHHAEGVSIHSLQVAVKPVQLLRPNIRLPKLPANTHVYDVRPRDVIVPTDRTTYWCHLQKLPDLKSKHHIIRYERVVTPGNENLVHHMEVFHCELSVQTELTYFSQQCNAEILPKELDSCRSVIAAWAMGAPPMVYPSNVGIPIGMATQSRYVLLQTHYNNPEHKIGRKDGSGIRFYYTSEVREHDVGILEVGLTYSSDTAIPPRQDHFKITGDCHSKCTEVGIPHQGINIFASQLHSHMTGRSIFTKRYRSGIELAEINRDDHYNPEFQEIRLLPKPINLKPGDRLTTTCIYNTKNRSNVTLSGYEIVDEMCVNYIHYWPKSNLEVCKSVPSKNSLDNFFKKMATNFADKTSIHNSTATNFRNIVWNNQKVSMLEDAFETQPIKMECLQNSGFDQVKYDWSELKLERIIKPLRPKKRHCKPESLILVIRNTKEKIYE